MNSYQTNTATSWGRNHIPTLLDNLTTAAMFMFCPFIILVFYLITYGEYLGSIGDFYLDIINGDWQTIWSNIPSFKINVLGACLLWIVFQLILSKLPDTIHRFVPHYVGGIKAGHITPAGNLVYYNINGLQAFIITHVLVIMSCYYGLFSPTIIMDNWGSIFWSVNIIGYLITFLAYFKALTFSSHPSDNKFTGKLFYDIVMGIEFNPEIFGTDLKLFFNGRPGIIAWNLINLSCAMKQYENFGYVSNSMILVIILQLIYIVDFFYNENWYVHTVDIAHDHFGWMLAWGDTVWLPFGYTLQAGYLMNNPIDLSTGFFNLVFVMGIIGYIIFRTANYQKDKYRSNTQGVKYIPCTYQTADGLNRASKLIYSGLWGVSRHMNYTGDIILSTAYCLACGFSHFIPYFYCVYMTILLVTRCLRDEQRCSRKYGKYWKMYTKRVPYRFIPGIY
ncbi:putative 7-dehydrocholesterol reductase [Acanthamoeba castellanii mimivirus]|jgi:7-dehydrocholesterol reductase|uniref:Probable 7-dehydrocholesterol reductase n=5 Tax=Mimivirus TaxID=315393 RepID=DHCR7_MIMIV|nr:probable 7-dehydrocholesterol reductase [Acanthamoeba polyphaga mimivirus]Q5UQI4.1 RecName: Full=Probable 7-dehydrocholesterol reductase; Short=7-DHC reductase; AltName: Full=Sterol Delta(7)-reductase [Acanthamoeba polyphaga mimivirus]AEQ61022.1 7-dehydrocholesterol reductase [Acanthamoeba castellanii mamavirus]AHA45021.1 putative 7-dehydrocholesterol reductase [Hirudovirus strain Sangsue]ALR84455.1 7-dehydrocholesterol reductase [Niemeyer virus]AMK62053.1 7-dehydrocholesterol reductase [Sa